jgi:hypothetical protein
MGKRILQVLKAISTAIGNVVGRILLTILYFVLLPPFAIWTRLRLDPLRMKSARAEWVPRPASPTDLESARQQY